jgi:hypothetical protein
MKFTNNFGLPKALVEAIKNDSYDPGDSDISTTSLISPPKINILRHKYWDDIEVDVVDQMFSLWGQSVHAILERVKTDCIKEKRYFWTHSSGWVISGQVDLLADRTLDDYKMTSVYKVQKGISTDWLQQLNVNAFLAIMNMEPVERIRIIAMMKDWSCRQAKMNWTYPKHPVKILEADLWDKDICEAFIDQRISLHKEARDSGILPDCTDEERWAQPEVWKCMKKGNKTSSKNCSTKQEAEEWVSNGKDSHLYTIIQSPKVFNRCEHYCNVNKWCHQYLDTVEKKDE